MHIRDWAVCLIEANKYDAQIIVDLLRNAGCNKIKVVLDSGEAIKALETYPANVVVMALESTPVDGVEWTKTFRRNSKVMNRKAAVFLTSRAFSRTVAEQCRHAGANALIGKPVSGAVLLATIQKVVSKPRQFIDAPNYVGPCRRAGIVTAGSGSRRRKSDDSAGGARAPTNTLSDAVTILTREVSSLINGNGNRDKCELAMKPLHAYAMNAGDGPMMRAIAALGLLLQAQNILPEALKAGLAGAVAGIAELGVIAIEETAKREALAEQVRQTVARTATQKAA